MVDFSNFTSTVVTGTGMRVVWAWIPERFALFSPIRLFNRAEHGKSLSSYVLLFFSLPCWASYITEKAACFHHQHVCFDR